MNKKPFHFSSDFFITWILIPLILLFMWVGFSLYFTSKYSLTVVASPHERSNFVGFNTSELLAGEKIQASFQAKDNNLGIVSVRFYNMQRISDDSVVFRIKQTNQKNWFYQQTYKVDQFQPNELFTFGFPIIPDSRGIKYSFEIQSLRGKPGDAIALSEVYPPFVTQYQYPKQQLLNDKAEMVRFMVNKLANSYSDRNFLIASAVYLLPLVFYFLWCWYFHVVIGIRRRPRPHVYFHSKGGFKESVRNSYNLIFVYLIALVILILFLEEANALVTIMVLALWLWIMKMYRFNGSVAFILSLIFLLFCPILLISGKLLAAQRAGLWVYYFLVIGTVFSLWEAWRQTKSGIDGEEFMRESILCLKHYFHVKKDK